LASVLVHIIALNATSANNINRLKQSVLCVRLLTRVPQIIAAAFTLVILDAQTY